MSTMQGRKIYEGNVTGEVLATSQGLSFYGGVDPESGVVQEVGHELEGQSLAGKILVFPSGKGSTVGSYSMYWMKKEGKAPLAIVNRTIDTIIAVGCIISEIPCVDQIDISQLKNGQKVTVNATEGTVTIVE